LSHSHSRSSADQLGVLGDSLHQDLPRAVERGRDVGHAASAST
jgi:hypothetical protein